MPDHTDVVCPFCGLLCDDLTLNTQQRSVQVMAAGCSLSRRRYAEANQIDATVAARIAGRSVSLDAAIGRAAEILGAAKAALIAGLATDVNGARQALRLADRCGGVIDHANSAALLKNTGIVQTSGWITTTFSEVRNRSDLVVVLGDRIFDLFPRLVERLIKPSGSFLPERLAKREVVLIGPWKSAGLPPELADATVFEVELEAIGDLVGVIRALLAQRPLDCESVSGVPLAIVRAFAERLQQADYSTLIWSAADLAFAHSELLIEQISELIRELNITTRSAGLPLAGSNGDITVNQVCTWQSGYPLRTGFSKAYPEFDPLLYDSNRFLHAGACDALLWVSALSADLVPPRSAIPTVVLAHPAMQLQHPAEVLITVGVPGIDHAGHLYRGDTVVSLPLRRLRDSALPSAAQVLQTIHDRIEAG